MCSAGIYLQALLDKGFVTVGSSKYVFSYAKVQELKDITF